jgi:8-oxo-dGTP diphosphatase
VTRTPPPAERAWLRSYDPGEFPPFALTVDVVLLTVRHGDFSVLLVERDTHPFRGALALPGGFVRPEEDLEEAAVRRLERETGVRRNAAHVEQLGAYGDPDRDPRMRVISVAYLVFAPDLPPPVPGRNTRSVAWVPVEQVDAPALAFDHERVLAAGVERARAKLEYTPLAAAFVGEQFTVAELRRVYEAVWGRPLDPRNFHRKVTGTPGFLVPVGKPAPVGPEGGRPAALFRRGHATLLHPAMLRPASR